MFVRGQIELQEEMCQDIATENLSRHGLGAEGQLELQWPRTPF
jgi:hypothetical protein